MSESTARKCKYPRVPLPVRARQLRGLGSQRLPGPSSDPDHCPTRSRPSATRETPHLGTDAGSSPTSTPDPILRESKKSQSFAEEQDQTVEIRAAVPTAQGLSNVLPFAFPTRMTDSVTQKMLEVTHQIVHSVHCKPAATQCTVACIFVRGVIRTESTARAMKHNSTEFRRC